MSKIFIEESTLTAIGDSIRAKTGKTDLIGPLDMPTEIASIQGGGDPIIKTVSGVCPITLENCAEGSLLDYKIYGAEGGVGDQTENLFDKHYDVGYNGTAPNVAKAPGGLSTEWYAIEDIGTIFTLALNPNTATTSVVVGYIQSNDKATINLRRGFTNAGSMPLGTDNFSNFSITNTSYAYVKFYVNNASLVNDIRMYRGANNKLTVPYGFYLPIKVNDTTHKLLLDYNLGDGDYLDFENRAVVKDSVPHYGKLPEIPLAEGSNTFDVDTTVKPSGVSLTYVKSVYFNTTETVEGTLPLTVDGVGQRLQDYKIYGAEGGVGNKTKNLCKGEFNVQYAKFDEPIPAGTHFSVSASAKGYDASDSTKKLRVRFFSSDNSQVTNIYPTLDSTGTKIKFDNLSYTKDITSYWLTNLKADEIQIEIGSVHTDYEPYGYRVGVKVNDTTSKIYIKEQLGADDYIDFENRIAVKDGMATYLDLPEIYLQNGTNIIDVDTTVKPSKMSVSFVDNDGGYDAGYKEAYDKMKIAIDMSDVTYRFNEKVTSYPSNWYRMGLNFTDANGVAYKQISTFTSSGKINIQYTKTDGGAVAAFNAANTPMWSNESYRTIHIIDGAMTGDIETFRWLFNNGVFNPTE